MRCEDKGHCGLSKLEIKTDVSLRWHYRTHHTALLLLYCMYVYIFRSILLSSVTALYKNHLSGSWPQLRFDKHRPTATMQAYMSCRQKGTTTQKLNSGNLRLYWFRLYILYMPLISNYSMQIKKKWKGNFWKLPCSFLWALYSPTVLFFLTAPDRSWLNLLRVSKEEKLWWQKLEREMKLGKTSLMQAQQETRHMRGRGVEWVRRISKQNYVNKVIRGKQAASSYFFHRWTDTTVSARERLPPVCLHLSTLSR